MSSPSFLHGDKAQDPVFITSAIPYLMVSFNMDCVSGGNELIPRIPLAEAELLFCRFCKSSSGTGIASRIIFNMAFVKGNSSLSSADAGVRFSLGRLEDVIARLP